jgi:Protein kinase domain
VVGIVQGQALFFAWQQIGLTDPVVMTVLNEVFVTFGMALPIGAMGSLFPCLLPEKSHESVQMMLAASAGPVSHLQSSLARRVGVTHHYTFSVYPASLFGKLVLRFCGIPGGNVIAWRGGFMFGVRVMLGNPMFNNPMFGNAMGGMGSFRDDVLQLDVRRNEFELTASSIEPVRLFEEALISLRDDQYPNIDCFRNGGAIAFPQLMQDALQNIRDDIGIKPESMEPGNEFNPVGWLYDRPVVFFSPPLLPLDWRRDVKVEDTLGIGAFGAVYEVSGTGANPEIPAGSKYALKVPSKEALDDGQEDLQNEMDVMRSLSGCEHAVCAVAAERGAGSVITAVLMPLFEMTLEDFIKKRLKSGAGGESWYSVREMCPWVFQIAQGLSYMHEAKGFAHFDVKTGEAYCFFFL